MWAEDIESWGAVFEYPVDDSPWVARPHMLQGDSDLERLKQVDFVHNGIHGKMLEYYEKMKEIAADYRVRFSDGKIIDVTELVYMGGAGIIGPMVMAGDLMSVEDLSLAFFDKPEYIRELLDIIVGKSIAWIDKAYEISKGKMAFANDFHEGYIFIGDDGTAQMSPQFIRDFALGPTKRLADHMRDKGLKVMAHNCGKADHLLHYWAEEVGINRYIGFSYLTDKQKIRETMGGSITLLGGLDTANLHDGTPATVREDVEKNLRIFRDVPGFVLMDGHNVAPGTPIENLNAVTEAARDFVSS
jgi:uroporphyrinogen-III decarboxylase